MKFKTTSGIKGTAHPYVHAHHTKNPNNPSLSRLKYILQLKHSVVNQIHFILHNIQIFLLRRLMVSICVQDKLILTL